MTEAEVKKIREAQIKDVKNDCNGKIAADFRHDAATTNGHPMAGVERSKKESNRKIGRIVTQKLSEEAKNQLLHYLRCSHCRRMPPLPDHWICTAGHLTCTVCARSYPFCPYVDNDSKMCKQSIVKVRASIIYRKIYNQSVWYCPHVEQGCQEKVLGVNLLKHKQDCQFSKKVACIYPSCGDATPFYANFIGPHWRDAHKLPVSIGHNDSTNVYYDKIWASISNLIPDYEEYLQVVLLLRCFGRYFAFGIYERQKELFMWIWRLDGGEAEDKHRTFVGHITVCGAKGETFDLPFKGICHNMDSETVQIVEEGDGLTLSKRAIEKRFSRVDKNNKKYILVKLVIEDVDGTNPLQENDVDIDDGDSDSEDMIQPVNRGNKDLLDFVGCKSLFNEVDKGVQVSLSGGESSEGEDKVRSDTPQDEVNDLIDFSI